jgi:radical SAM protein with 4Fe4S-binding SPASM domain
MKNLKELRELDGSYFKSMVRLSMTLMPPGDLAAVDKFIAEVGIPPRVSLVQTYGTKLLDPGDTEGNLSSEESLNLMKKFTRAAISGTVAQRPTPEEYLFCLGLYWGGVRKLHLRSIRDGFENSIFKYSNLCIPGASKIFVTTDGQFYVCERVDGMRDLCIGNLKTGIDVNKVLSLVQQFNAFRDETCKHCWAIRFCSMCFASTYHFDGWNREKISHYCEVQKREYKNALKLYCSILEENHLGLDFIVEEEQLHESSEVC